MSNLPARLEVIDPARLVRAIHLDAVPIDIHSYLVSGGSADHVVEVVDGEVWCNCRDSQIHGANCKHALLILLLSGDPDVVRALR